MIFKITIFQDQRLGIKIGEAPTSQKEMKIGLIEWLKAYSRLCPFPIKHDMGRRCVIL